MYIYVCGIQLCPESVPSPGLHIRSISYRYVFLYLNIMSLVTVIAKIVLSIVQNMYVVGKYITSHIIPNLLNCLLGFVKNQELHECVCLCPPAVVF